jgi:hypothetical protein
MAAGRTYTPIARTTLTSAAASVTFSNISGSYTDLILVANNIIPSGSMDITMYVNGDTATNYSTTSLNGDGTTARSGRVSTQSKAYISDFQVAINGSNPTMFIVNFNNYSNTTTYKTFLSRGTIQGASSAGETNANISLWRSTSAITSITLQTSSGTMGVGSTFTLYGIAAA